MSDDSVVIEFEPDPAGHERDDELVQRDALLGSTRDELLVKGRRAANEDAAVGGHTPHAIACTIDTGDSACNITGMTRMAYLMEPLNLRMLGDNTTMPRYRWQELLYDLRPESDLARRIREMIA